MAASATLHCLTCCAIGEIVGLMDGTATGLTNVVTIALAVGLAFLFGYTLSTVPLIPGPVLASSAGSGPSSRPSRGNRYVIKGKGHALTHQFHHGHEDHAGQSRTPSRTSPRHAGRGHQRSESRPRPGPEHGPQSQARAGPEPS
jgi:hypothetical protein